MRCRLDNHRLPYLVAKIPFRHASDPSRCTSDFFAGYLQRNSTHIPGFSFRTTSLDSNRWTCLANLGVDSRIVSSGPQLARCTILCQRLAGTRCDELDSNDCLVRPRGPGPDNSASHDFSGGGLMDNFVGSIAPIHHPE